MNTPFTYTEFEDVYYGTSDMGFESVIDFYEPKCFIGVIGGLYFLNFLGLANFKEVILVDVNPYAIEYAKEIIKAILECKNKDDFWRILSKNESEYGKNIRQMSRVVNEDWEEVRKGINGRTRFSPLDGWKYAFDNLDRVKKNLEKVQYVNMNIVSGEFDKLVDRDCWVWLSNIYRGFDKRKGRTVFQCVTNYPKDAIINIYQ